MEKSMLWAFPSFENLQRLLHDSSIYCLVKVTVQGEYEYINNHFLERYAAHYQDSEKYQVERSILACDRDLAKAIFLKCMNNPGDSFSVNLKMTDGSEGLIVVNWEFRAYLNQSGDVENLIGIGSDISANESKINHIGYLTHVLNEIAQQQSHAVRRPLANIIGLINLLSDPKFHDPETGELIKMLNLSCTDLLKNFDLFLIRNSTLLANKDS
jgi:hypothetical protein